MIKKIIVCGAIAAACAATYYFLIFSYPRTYAVALTKDGFFPPNLTIRRGDAVVFTTQLNKQFWPASNPHPTHTIYPAFDPRKPVNPGEAWKFIFTQAGTWNYHDHLDPAVRAVIIVLEGSGGGPALDCAHPGEQNKIQCWETSLYVTLGSKGLDAAFQELAALYETDPYFAANCHGFVHTLGAEAYKMFSLHEEIRLSPKTSYCGYGFYHGFMEALLRRTADPARAREFCDYAQKQLAAETSDAGGACFHGIGHGSVDGGDPRAWGDAGKMIEPGIKLCEKVSVAPMELYRCVSGAMNALEILSSDPKYRLTQIVHDPFSFCIPQPKKYKEACYTNMLPALGRILGGDFKKQADRIEKIPHDGDEENMAQFGYTVRDMVASSLFHEYVRLHTDSPDYDMKDGIALCRSLYSDMRLACFDGLAGGHMKYGEPEKEYIKGLAFCRSNELKEDERDACFGYILPRLRIWYTEDKSRTICNSIDQKYQHYCGN